MTFKQTFWLAVLTSIIGPIVVALIRYFFNLGVTAAVMATCARTGRRRNNLRLFCM